MENQSEVNNFMKVCTTIFLSLYFCHEIVKKVSPGTKRLVLTLPIITLFLFLPLKLKSINLGVTISFFITWLCTFKLVLFSFNKGPLSHPQITSLSGFIVVSCLPIEIRQRQQQTPPNHNKTTTKIKTVIKLSFLAALYFVFNLNDKRMKSLTSYLYFPLVYLLVETIMAGLAGLARAVIRADLEPQFDEPYMSTSLEDFWFRRYNLPVSHIMKTAVQDPILSLWADLVGPRWAFIPAVMGSFLVNGLVHELIYYYVGRTWPTWEVTCFFLLHGSFLTAEICFEKDTWRRVPRAVLVCLVNGFVVLTTAWLFFPPLLRLGFEARLFGEYRALGLFLKSVAEKATFNYF